MAKRGPELCSRSFNPKTLLRLEAGSGFGCFVGWTDLVWAEVGPRLACCMSKEILGAPRRQGLVSCSFGLTAVRGSRQVMKHVLPFLVRDRSGLECFLG